MERMRAVVLPAVNAPLTVEEIPVPTPKAGEVLIRVAACGVCHTDLHVIKGEVAFPTPAVLGHEISGTVVALGRGARGVEEDRRVRGAAAWTWHSRRWGGRKRSRRPSALSATAAEP